MCRLSDYRPRRTSWNRGPVRRWTYALLHYVIVEQSLLNSKNPHFLHTAVVLRCLHNDQLVRVGNGVCVLTTTPACFESISIDFSAPATRQQTPLNCAGKLGKHGVVGLSARAWTAWSPSQMAHLCGCLHLPVFETLLTALLDTQTSILSFFNAGQTYFSPGLTRRVYMVQPSTN